MMSLPIWLPGPMFLLGGVSVQGVSIQGISVWESLSEGVQGVFVKGGLCQGDHSVL